MQHPEPPFQPGTQALISDHPSTGSDTVQRWLLKHRDKLVVNGILAVLLAVGLILIYGLVPNRQISSLGINLITIGQGQSLALSGFNLYLPHMGYPFGAPVVFGLPFTLVSGFIIALTGVSPYLAYILTAILFLAVAVTGCVLLLRQLGASMPVALIFTFLFYGSPFMWGHLSYGQLPFAFALLPAYLLLDKTLLERLYHPDRRWRVVIVWTLIYGAARIVSLFMDGYSFVIWGLASGIIFLWYGYQSLRVRRFVPVIVSFAILAIGSGAAYLMYGAYVPGGSEYDVMPIDMFRAMSVDLMTLFVPQRPPYALSWLGLPDAFYQAGFFYGDGSNIAYNYLGYGLIISLAGYLIWLRRRSRFETALLAAAAIAFVLSIGPSLKINSQRAEPKPPDAPWLYEDYLMPADEAIMSLGSDFIYTEVPGINIMRAVYRWLLLPKLALIVIGALFAERLLRQRRYVIFALVIGVSLVETLPPVPSFARQYERNYAQLQALDADVVAPLREHVQPGDRILFFTSSLDNDYLASYLGPQLGAYSYNVGGDKNTLIAFEHWPDGVRAVRWEVYVNEYVTQMFQDDELDWFIIPFFNLRRHSYSWPPSPAEVEEIRNHRSALFNLNNPNFAIIESEYFYLIRFNEWLREQLGLS